MAPVSMHECPLGDTGTTQPLEMPSATTSSSPSPSREHDPLTGDSATGESPQSQAPRLSVVSLATTTPPAMELPNPEAGHLPPAQTPDADPSAVPASPVLHNDPPSETRNLPHVTITQSQGAGPSAAASLEPAGTETGYPPHAPDPIAPQPVLQAGINLLAVPHDAQEHDVEAQRPWPARFWSWCGAPWTCHNTVTTVIMLVVGIPPIAGFVWVLSRH